MSTHKIARRVLVAIALALPLMCADGVAPPVACLAAALGLGHSTAPPPALPGAGAGPATQDECRPGDADRDKSGTTGALNKLSRLQPLHRLEDRGDFSLEPERAGFEPAVPLAKYTRFPSVLLKPLGHLSNGGHVDSAPDTQSADAAIRTATGYDHCTPCQATLPPDLQRALFHSPASGHSTRPPTAGLPAAAFLG
jgi:hypothetical protein